MISTEKKPGIFISLIPVLFLMFCLAINIYVFGDDATSGSNQLALLIAGALSAAIGIIFYNQKYAMIEKQILSTIGLAMQANIILIVVGALIGTWIISGIVPTMIYYGLKLIHPSVFLPVCCVVCSIVSLATGSSWSTTGTVGIALIGIGETLGVPSGMVAGSILSGAYFGDKMSPLSDTTNLAPAIAGTDIFTHIHHMMYTTIPAYLIALTGFIIIGFVYNTGAAAGLNIQPVLDTIENNFNIGIHLFIPPLLVMIMVLKKIPAIPALITGAIIGAVFALFFQTELLNRLAGDSGSYMLIVKTAYSGFSIETGNAMIDSLFSRGGSYGMLNTVWLIMMAMFSGFIFSSSTSTLIVSAIYSVSSRIELKSFTCTSPPEDIPIFFFDILSIPDPIKLLDNLTILLALL